MDRFSLRHPRECKYFREYNRCKFGSFCFYRHEIKIDIQNEKLENEIKQMKEKQKELCKRIEVLDQLINEKFRQLSDLEENIRIEETIQKESKQCSE